MGDIEVSLLEITSLINHQNPGRVIERVQHVPDLYLDPCPPSLRFAQPPTEAAVQPLRPEIAGSPDDVLPSELADLGTQPVAYVSLGTVALFNQLTTFEFLLGV